MTALDKAFIKAYKHQGPAGQPAPTAAAQTAHGSSAVDGKGIEDRIASTSAKLNDVMAALQKPSGKIVDTPTAVEVNSGLIEEQASRKNETDVLAFAQPTSARVGKSKTTQKRKKKTSQAPTLDELDVPEVVYRLDPPCPTIPDAPRSSTFTAQSNCEKASPESNIAPSIIAPTNDLNTSNAAGSMIESDISGMQPLDMQKTRRIDAAEENVPPPIPATYLQTKGFTPESTIRVFQPMLQVDHFAWPKVCHRIESIAGAELDRLAETLLVAGKKGMKVIGISGGQRGEGATTLLLCAARRLAAQNMKIVIIDADLGEPQLAKRLGLLPQLGWEDVAAGRQPVDEVLVESTADNIAILPLCGSLSISEISYAAQRLMAESLNTLRNNYDLVLVDLGPLENSHSISDLASGGLNCRIDAVTVVHKVGKVLATCLPIVRQTLATAGITIAGVIENFVNDPVSTNM